MAFIKLKSNNLGVALPSGNAIIALSESVFSTEEDSEWAKFVLNPHDWLYEKGYRYVDKNYVEIGDGRIPATLELVPVYDSETRMHIQIPHKKTLQAAQLNQLQAEPNYQLQFPAVLAHYFMRKCR